MLYGVANQALKNSVKIKERKELLSLIVENDRCYGAVVRDTRDGTIEAYLAKATCIATGGWGRVYRTTTNAEFVLALVKPLFLRVELDSWKS